MAYRATTSRDGSKSPLDGEDRGKAPKLTVDTNVAINDNDNNDNDKFNVDASSFKPARSANKYLLYDSTPDDGPVIVRSNPSDNPAAPKTNGNGKPLPSPIGTVNGISPTREKVNFTTDVVPGIFIGSHYIKVEVVKGSFGYLFQQLDDSFNWDKTIRSFLVKPDSEDKKMEAYIVFDDVRKAARARDHVSIVVSTADVSYVTQPEFAGVQRDQEAHLATSHLPSTSFFDGQVMFYGRFDGPVSICRADGLEDRVRALAQTFGDVLALGEMDGKNGMARFRAEFMSIKAAKEVVKKLSGKTPAQVGGWFVFAQELADITTPPSSVKDTGAAGRTTPTDSDGGDSSPTFVSPTGRTAWNVNTKTGEVWSVDKTDSDHTSPVNGGAVTMHHSHHVPTPPAMQVGFINQNNGGVRHGPWVHQQHSQHMAVQQYTGGYAPQFGFGRNDYMDNSQAVVPENIGCGIDVRTTIMLRNLPNQMTCHKLKELLDVSNFGEYDFFYVRIDYKKNASVGYGFVNFIDPAAILNFLDAYVGFPWMPELTNRRGAARVAEVSYATIQGYDCCIEKFRNSSVMTEYPDYRPKLWYTKATAPTEKLIGTEIDFPAVNNISKHQRSLANATQIGLFPPQSRRGPGAQHRSGHSQWDRGTTAQRQEDAAFQIDQQLQGLNIAAAAQFHPHPHGQFGYAGQPMPAPYPFDVYGRPIYANHAAMAPPPGWYPQPGPGMPPMAPGYPNGFGPNHVPGAHFGGHNGHQNGNGAARVAGPGPQNGNGAARVAGPRPQNGNGAARAAGPRPYPYYDADNDPNAYDGDVDAAGMTGYHNSTHEKKKD